MAIIPTSNTGWGPIADTYDGARYYEEQERRYRQERERQQMLALQNQYCINTDTYRVVSAKEMEEAKPANKVGETEPDYITNKNLLLLGATS